MSNYPHNTTNPSGYPYNAPPPSQPYTQGPYGGGPPHPSQSYPSAPYGSTPSGPPPPNQSTPYAPLGSQYPAPPGAPIQPYGGYPAPYVSTFTSPAPSAFPPGTDPNVIAHFQMADRDGSGFIDDKELQQLLSSYNESFGMRTVHLLMYLFTNSNVRKIGPKEFTQIFYCLQGWRGIFERYDRDKSGKIDSSELRDALLGLGFSVSPPILDLLISKFDNSGGKNRAFEYDNFIECCLTVKVRHNPPPPHMMGEILRSSNGAPLWSTITHVSPI
ncbi:hypothetical protein OROMI_028382 [Orobanche minor]